MGKGRLEAFSDGVLAIIITIMVLELKIPHGTELADLKPATPIFLGYVLSFAYIGIYWNNHHHLLHASQHIDGRVLWANLHLLFWLSLVPVTTAWVGENSFASWPVASYGIVLLFSAIAYFILTKTLIAHHGKDSLLARSIGNDRKGRISVAVYAVSIALSFARPWAAYVCYVLVVIMWLLPDPRIERNLRAITEEAALMRDYSTGVPKGK